jgi:glutaryl-CoA dehydrogenase
MRHMTNLESVLTYEGTEEVHTLVIGEQLAGQSLHVTNACRSS